MQMKLARIMQNGLKINKKIHAAEQIKVQTNVNVVSTLAIDGYSSVRKNIHLPVRLDKI